MKDSLSIKEQLHENITRAPVTQVFDEWRMAYAFIFQRNMKRFFS
jgi:hypothetical protein